MRTPVLVVEGEEVWSRPTQGGERAIILSLSGLRAPRMSALASYSETKGPWPVAMMAAYDDGQSRRRAIGAGAAGVLTEPLAVDELGVEIDQPVSPT